MRAIEPALAKAFALSLLLHGLLFTAGDWLNDPVRGASGTHEAQLDVTLLPPEALAQVQPALLLEEPLLPAAPPPARALSAHAGRAAKQISTLTARELLYPPEAVARGLEGQALVLLFLDASGNPIAARLEASSGHALLDDAALRAAKTLRALPDSAPREALLPVRFRLR
jgi:protein TonB